MTFCKRCIKSIVPVYPYTVYTDATASARSQFFNVTQGQVGSRQERGERGQANSSTPASFRATAESATLDRSAANILDTSNLEADRIAATILMIVEWMPSLRPWTVKWQSCKCMTVKLSRLCARPLYYSWSNCLSPNGGGTDGTSVRHSAQYKTVFIRKVHYTHGYMQAGG